jgi:hypothetical protein
MVNHAEEYVRGHVHTNGIENFWSLVKRCLNGTYISVMPFHLFRYLDEQAFRFNNRKFNDSERCHRPRHQDLAPTDLARLLAGFSTPTNFTSHNRNPNFGSCFIISSLFDLISDGKEG